ncbi:MAG: hypothetical protein CVU54_13560 [Deltaproteobacteria bacterium HGW-Deltaproteobacteria-12]|jgi:hypothetical protein|nr:MAG: hypothetical protein CVU54_13560 [Deltaproteobacteria bacterium HGW-Deltaproteobacteria-12]
MTAKRIIKSASKKSETKPTVKRASKRSVVAFAAAKPSIRKMSGAKIAAKKMIGVPPSGYSISADGLLLVPSSSKYPSITPASKLRDGITKAKNEIRQSLQEIATLMTMDFEISEIEFSVSFSADGKFLGFGVGGAASIKVKIKPVENDA